MFTRVIKGLLLTAISVVLVMSLSAQTIDWGEDIETNKLVAKIVGETDDIKLAEVQY